MLMKIKRNTIKTGHIYLIICRDLLFWKTGGSGSGKRNALINLINEQNGIDKIYLHA